MAVITKRKNNLKSKSSMKTKKSFKSKSNSKTRKQFKNIRKNGMRTRKMMRGGFFGKSKSKRKIKPVKPVNPPLFSKNNTHTVKQMLGNTYYSGKNPDKTKAMASAFSSSIQTTNSKPNINKNRESFMDIVTNKRSVMAQLRQTVSNGIRNKLSPTHPQLFNKQKSKANALLNAQEIINNSKQGVFLPSLIPPKNVSNSASTSI